jgi:hypothetical protein
MRVEKVQLNSGNSWAVSVNLPHDNWEGATVYIDNQADATADLRFSGLAGNSCAVREEDDTATITVNAGNKNRRVVRGVGRTDTVLLASGAATTGTVDYWIFFPERTPWRRSRRTR